MRIRVNRSTHQVNIVGIDNIVVVEVSRHNVVVLDRDQDNGRLGCLTKIEGGVFELRQSNESGQRREDERTIDEKLERPIVDIFDQECRRGRDGVKHIVRQNAIVCRAN